MRKTIAFLKSFILFLRPGAWLGFMAAPLQLTANTLRLSQWIGRQQTRYTDFYRPSRNYSLRYDLYDYVVKTEKLENEPITYLEFGVAKGLSFQWWMNKNKHPQSRFYGFDTFEGLPEKWGTFSKGAMSFGVPEVEDGRHEFYKGLFQDTLFSFIDTGKVNENNRKVIHLDADLYSSTLFVLTTLHRYLCAGDILIFDEFNVPNHEFLAFENYIKAFYVKYEVVGAVNNYFQVAIKVLK